MSAPMTLQFSLPMEKGRAGKPRLYPYDRLLSRVYEALFLLYSLSQTRAPHSPYPISGFHQGLRRVFMRNLAVICDGQKGRLTFTAFAVAEVGGNSDGEFVFFVASKRAGECEAMLSSSLTMLLQYVTAKEEEKPAFQRSFLERCVDHAKMRIRAYISDLERATPGCISELERRNQPVTNGEFISWLRSLLLRHDGTDSSHVNVCMDMCRASVSTVIVKLHQEERQRQHSYAEQGGLPHFKGGCFARAWHAIGRLSARVNKPLSLLRDARLMRDILSGARVEVIGPLTCVPKPLLDQHTTMPRVLRRMFGTSDDKEMLRTQEILEDMEQNSCLRPLTRYMDSYRECNPSVHSEIEVLEHFYKHKLKFLDSDRYVYSSKPACFACKPR